MPKNISFTNTARKQLIATTDYINKDFGNKVTNQFIDKLEEMLASIAEGFMVCKFFNEKRNIRYFNFQRKNYILYRETKNTIRVVGIYGTKQNILSKKK
jgi:plasmid stabilization system protein ParE